LPKAICRSLPNSVAPPHQPLRYVIADGLAVSQILTLHKVPVVHIYLDHPPGWLFRKTSISMASRDVVPSPAE
jgi:hypothetical protein